MTERTNDQVNEQINYWMTKWLNERMIEWMNDWTNEWMNEKTNEMLTTIHPLHEGHSKPHTDLETPACVFSLTLASHNSDQTQTEHKKRKSGIAFPFFIPRLDERHWVETCVL